MREIVPRLTLSFYDEHWRELPEYQAAQDLNSATKHYARNDDSFIEGVARLSVKKPDYFVAKEARARAYYDRLGFNDLSELYLITDDATDADLLHFESPETAIAQQYPRYDVILAMKKHIDNLRAVDDNYIDTAIAHELFHATTIPKVPHANFIRSTRGKKYKMHFRSGFIVDNEGWFFEEGAAVFMAANYVRSLNGDNKPLGITGPPGPDLPEYIAVPDSKMTAGPDGYAIELIGYFAVQSGAMSAENYNNMLLDTRRERMRSRALRTFARLVDDIEPGLYVKLRKLEYGKKSWEDGLMMTYQGVMQALE